jgi:hypothetical protein
MQYVHWKVLMVNVEQDHRRNETDCEGQAELNEARSQEKESKEERANSEEKITEE